MLLFQRLRFNSRNPSKQKPQPQTDPPNAASAASFNPHHAAPSSAVPRLDSIAFTLTVDKQDGRRFSGTFSSARGNDPLIGVISRNGTILVVDDDGYTVGTVLAPNRVEFCYMMLSPATRIASCTELTKEP